MITTELKVYKLTRHDRDGHHSGLVALYKTFVAAQKALDKLADDQSDEEAETIFYEVESELVLD